MKAIIIAISILGFLFSTPSKLKAQSASKIYLEHFFDIYVPIQKDMWALTVSISKEHSPADIASKKSILTKTLRAQRSKVKASPNFENDSTLRLQVLHWLNTTSRILGGDYNYLIQLKNSAKLSPENMREYLKFKEVMNKSYKRNNEQLKKVVDNFSAKNNLNVNEENNKLSTKLNKANNAFNYYDKIYLSFFDAYYYEALFNTAVNSRSYVKIEQAKSELEKQIIKSQNELINTGSFETDKKLNQAAQNIIKSYENMMNSYGNDIYKLYKTKHDLDSVKTVVSAKSAFERTPEDVALYNSLVKNYNAQAPSISSKTQQFNSSRKAALNQWNIAVDIFINEHVL
ncbi:MAG: LIC11966 family surface protein [Salibacteraceae bacterium]